MENAAALTVYPVGHSLSHHIGAAARYVEAGLNGAANTSRAYTANLRRFSVWCLEHELQALPALVDTLVRFCTHLAEQGKKVATLEQHCAAIAKAHAVRGVDSPTDNKQFKIFMDGVRRLHGVRQKQAPAFTLPQLKQLVRNLDIQTAIGLRDRAILLLGFTGAFRRSELTTLNVQDLNFTDDCLVVSLGKSKTNQLGDHDEKAIFYSPEPAFCPVRSLKSWLEQLERSEGPVFVMLRKGNRLTTNRLSEQSINTLVQRYFGPSYTAHSLRASFVTLAKLNGADDSKIMNQTKHKTSAMIRRYTRLNNVQQHNAAKELGL